MTTPTKHWTKLPSVRGYTRVEDDRGRRMVRCNDCGKLLPSLGVGYHRQGGKECTRRAGS